MKQFKKYRSSLIVTMIVAGSIGGLIYLAMQPGKLDAFAQCLADEEVIYWGAFWCGACQEQNRMFGNSKKYLPYIECSTPDGQRQTQQCADAEIEGYPTWEFPDGERVTGVVPVQSLSERTGCPLPE